MLVESRNRAAEGVVIALALLIFIGYHLWAFFIAGQGCLTTRPDSYGLNGKGRIARVIFASNICENSKHAILGVQNARNGMMGVSFQAGVAAIFFNLLLQVMLDKSQLTFVGTFARKDPLLRATDTLSTQTDPTPKIGMVSVRAVILVNLCIILVAMMLFVVCVRLYIHMGYFFGAATNKTQEWIKVQDAVEVTLRAQMVYTAGQRLMFMFPITIIWLVGPLAMLIASVVITSGIAYVDRWNPRWESNYRNVLTNIATSSFRRRRQRRFYIV